MFVFQAEVDFDGRALTRSYLEKHDLNILLEVILIIFLLTFIESPRQKGTNIL